MSTQFTLKSAYETDATLLSAIHEECFPNYWNHEAFTDFFSVQNTHALLASPSPLVGEGREGGATIEDTYPPHHPPSHLPPQGGKEFAGMAVYRIAGEQADMLTLAVRPSWRKQGAAHLLLTETLIQCKRHGASALFLDVEDGNLPAIRLYEANGFTQINRRKLYYRQKDGTYTDALVMTKKL